jgi:eukaryotic-like serine/threonine-protein kinase
MGAIYEVIDIKTQRRRALKLMLPSLVTDEDMRARFKLEATVTANIESEHIVETFDADVDPETGSPFLVMELLRGNDLADTLTERTRLAGPEVVQLLAQAARALDKTHAAGIVHRDLKPENLFITRRDDGSIRVKILDFGIAKVVAASEGQQKKQQTINLGTPPYMSPEQILGDATIDHRADLYALAHIAYALLVGEPYWLEESRNGDTLYRLLLRMVDGVKEPPTERAERYGVTLPREFDGWFMRATAKNPGDRYNRASELVMALADVLNVPLNQRPPTASLPDGDWEIESLMLSKAAVQRLVSIPPEAALISVQTPPTPVVSVLKPPSVTGLTAPVVAQPPAPVPSIPPESLAPPANPTPPEMPVEVPPPASTRPNRRAIWLLMAFALVLGFVGVFIVSGSPDKPVAPATSATASVSAVATTTPPVAEAVDAGTSDADAEVSSPVIAVSASATSSASTPLPPSASTGKTLPSATRKIPGPGPSTKTKHDPLKTL